MWITNDKKLFKIITQRCKPPTAQWLTIPYVVCKINLAARGKFEVLEYLKVDAQHSKQAKIYQPQIDKAISQTPACYLDQKWLKPRFPFSLHGFFVLESLHDRAPKIKGGKIRRTHTHWGIFEDNREHNKQTKWLSSIELEKSLGERYHVISWWAKKKTFSNTKWAYSRWVLLILSRFECISTQCCRKVWATVHKEIAKLWWGNKNKWIPKKR